MLCDATNPLFDPVANSVQGTLLEDQSWLKSFAPAQSRAAKILSASPQEQQREGYSHTLREIFQQPSTWLSTAERMISACAELRSFLAGSETVVLTGSGSSEFVGHCVRAPL